MAGNDKTAKQPVKPGSDVKVTIGRVIRGNPYVDRNAKPTRGLSDSLPPTKTYQVEIQVNPPLDRSRPDNFIEVSIAGSSDENGTATVTPAKITQTTVVTVTGGNQTKPKNAGNLKIQASLGGKVVAVSPGFTVCAHPLNFGDVYDSDIDETLQGLHVIGMNVRDSWESDSGQAALNRTLRDLNKVTVKELLFEPPPKEPPFKATPFDHSGDNLGIIFSTDRHSIIYPDPGPAADWTISQLSVYSCERCGCTDVLMPNSGLKITFHVENKNGWQFWVEKVGAQVMVNHMTATPGTASIKTKPVPIAAKEAKSLSAP